MRFAYAAQIGTSHGVIITFSEACTRTLISHEKKREREKEKETANTKTLLDSITHERPRIYIYRDFKRATRLGCDFSMALRVPDVSGPIAD